jgi:hypothetical protein
MNDAWANVLALILPAASNELLEDPRLRVRLLVLELARNDSVTTVAYGLLVRGAGFTILTLVIAGVTSGCGGSRVADRQARLVYAEAAAFPGLSKTISTARADGGHPTSLVKGDLA